jgi:hypothetical protein
MSRWPAKRATMIATMEMSATAKNLAGNLTRDKR